MENKQSVLVIDDSPTVRRLAELALSKGGYDVLTAENGDEGLEIAKKELPSVILVDFIMPKMNGFQLCKKIRSDSSLSDVPIVLITSKGKDVGQGFEEKFGVSHYLQKPFESETLTKTVQDVLAQTAKSSDDHSADTSSEAAHQDAEETAPSADETPANDTLSSDISFVDINSPDTHSSEAQPVEPYSEDSSPAYASEDTYDHTGTQSVLVIDDSPTVRRLAELALSKGGYDVLTAENGDEGLEIAKKELPSVILVDFIMPKMNGFQLCKKIRSDSSLSDVPIVLITSKGKDVGQGFEEKFGVSHYLQKPFESETLIKTVQDVLAQTAKSSDDHSADTSSEAAHQDAEETAPSAEQSSHHDILSSDISFVEITATDIRFSEDKPTAPIPSDESFISSPDAQRATVESDVQEKTPPVGAQNSPFESSEVVNDGADQIAAPSNTSEFQEPSPACSTQNAPVDAPAQEIRPAMNIDSAAWENISKEFRHYFGQELSFLLKGTMIQALKETGLVQSSRRILSGELMYISSSHVIKFACMAGISGKLSVLTNDFNSEIYLENGRIVFASISRSGYSTSLEELILKDRTSRQRDILTALCESRGSNLAAGGILLDRGLVTEDELIGYYRHLSEEAVRHTLTSNSGHFYIEDVPLPPELMRIKPENRVTILDEKQLESLNNR